MTVIIILIVLWIYNNFLWWLFFREYRHEVKRQVAKLKAGN